MAFWVNWYVPVSGVKVSVFFALCFEVFLVWCELTFPWGVTFDFGLVVVVGLVFLFC